MQYLDTYSTIYYRWYVYMYAAWNMNLHSSLHTEKFWVNSRLRAEVTQLQGRELTLPQREKKKKQIPHQFSNMPSQAKTWEVKHGGTVGTIRSNWAVKWVQSKVPLDPWVYAERTVAQTRESSCFSLHAGGFKWMKKTVYNTENEKGCDQGTRAP